MSSSGEQSIQDGSRELQWEGQWAVEENDQYDGGSCELCPTILTVLSN